MKVDMASMTFRQMKAVSELWAAHVGPGGEDFMAAIARRDIEAMAAIVAYGNGITIDEALDRPFSELSEDDAPEVSGGGNGAQPRPSPVSGS